MGSNLLTGIKVDSLSRKEKRALQHQYDSLNRVIVTQEKIHLGELILRRKIFLEDSILKVKLQLVVKTDQALIKQQKLALSKFTNLTAHQAISKLDSAYEAEVNHHP